MNYLLIKYIKSVLWRVAKSLSYREEARCLKVNNGTIPRDWKNAIVFPIHKVGDRSVVKNYRPVSLTSVVQNKWNTS